MSKVAVFAFALCTALSSTTAARAAAPVETAIADWVAGIDSASDWSARFDNLSYDTATDTAVLTGLTIENGRAGLMLSFDPISVSGYVERDDGSFEADGVSTDGATIAATGLSGRISDIRLEGLANVTKDFSTGIEWDPQRPATSLIQAYARFVDVRLAHGTFGELSLELTYKRDSIPASYQFSYKNLVIDDWTNGKITNVSAGPVTSNLTMPNGTVRTAIASTSARDIDYAAITRVYDPDQYAGGVGDHIWRNAMSYAEIKDISIEVGLESSLRHEMKETIGLLAIEDFRVRQPTRSVNEFLDRVMLDPEANEAPTPDELRAALDYLSSLSLGAITLRDFGMEIDADHGGTTRISEIAIRDFSSEGIGEFSIDDLAVRQFGDGVVDIDRLAFGGVVFPPIEAFVEAAEAEEAGEEFDYARFATQLAFFEANAVDIDMPDNPHVKLDKARLDLGNYVGPIPTLMALEVAGADLPVTAIEEPRARAMWQALGYDRIHGDFDARLTWNENDESVAIDDFRAAIDGVGALSLNAVLSGLSRAALDNLDGLPAALAGLDFVRGTLSLENYDILDRWIDRQAALSGSEPATLRRQLAALLAEMTSGFGDVGFQERLRQVLEASVMVPGSITATAMPSIPVPLAALAILAQSAPASLPDLLGLTIESGPAR